MTPQVQMLLECVEILQEEGRYDVPESFDRLVCWLAMQASVPSGHEDYGISTPSISLDAAEQLDRTLDLSLFSEIGDHLRDVAAALGILTPAGAQGFQIVNTDELTRPAIFDPRCGSGSNLVELFKEHGRGYLYYGASQSLLEYRMTLVTCHLCRIPCRIILADATIHDLEITSGNWKFAGYWFPPADKRLERIVTLIR
jgi:hypothetical protein